MHISTYIERERGTETGVTWPARRTKWPSTGAAFAGCDDVTRTCHSIHILMYIYIYISNHIYTYIYVYICKYVYVSI